MVAGSQAAAPVALSGALRAHVKDERFGIVTSIRGLPLGVRDGLQTLFGSQALDIAEPGAEFQVTDVIVDPKLPIRRLVAAGCSTDHCLVYYERGGIAHTWQVALFHWTPAATGSSGAVSRHAAWRQSTTFGTPSCPERSRARPSSGSSSVGLNIALQPTGAGDILSPSAEAGRTVTEESGARHFGKLGGHDEGIQDAIPVTDIARRGNFGYDR